MTEEKKPKKVSKIISILIIILILLFISILLNHLLKFQSYGTAHPGMYNLKMLFKAQIDYYSENGRYAKSFEELDWKPKYNFRYAYFLSRETARQPEKMPPRSIKDYFLKPKRLGPYSLPDGIEAFVDDETFQIIMVGNIDYDDVLDIWMINDRKELKHLFNDVDLDKWPEGFR